MFIGKFIGLKIQASVMLLVFLTLSVCLAQRPQDNWYHERTFTKTMAATNGGLNTAYGVAVGPDGRIYVGDQGLSRVQVYLPDGTFSFAITNNFGGGQSFSCPRGMITDKDCNLYVADNARNAVFVFTKDGEYIRTIGGVTGSGDGQMSGVLDVGVGPSGEVYVLEYGNVRVSVFANDGTFLRKWGGLGTLEGQFYHFVTSLAVGPDSSVYVGQRYQQGIDTASARIKVFTSDGVYKRSWETLINSGSGVNLGVCSIRVDSSGLVNVMVACIGVWSNFDRSACDPYLIDYTSEGSAVCSLRIYAFTDGISDFYYPIHAVGRDGSVVIVGKSEKQLFVVRQAFREQVLSQPNAIPFPAVNIIQQRPNSPLVDIDYQVTDTDDTNVCAYMLGFTNATQSLATCLRSMTFAEGTETNIGAAVTANQPHRVTWNAGADLNVKLGDFRVAVLAKDSRQKLLDIHYIRLPADRGMPELKISRSPLVPNDFMQVWWWLLATQDSSIRLTGGKIYGSGGAFDSQLLCDATGTTADGRTYIYAKLNVREATSQELQFAKEGALAGNVNQWSPSGITVGGRPLKVNEYGFDTGSWGTSAWWVVPLY